MNPTDPTDDELARRARDAFALRDAPAAWVHAAVGLWPPQGLGIAATARRLLAALRFDSAAATPALLGVRGAPSGSRQLLFSAEGRDIDLRVTALAGGFAVAGQVLGPDEHGRLDLVSATTEAVVAASANLDALGEFRIDGIRAGRYRLVLTLGHDEIVLPDIDVGDGAG